MLKQLQKKFRLSILSLLGLVSVLGVLPFSILRFFEENYTAAIIDLALVLGIGGLVGYAIRTQKTRVASFIVAVFIAGGVVAMVAVNGISSFLWVYPVFAGTFFLVKPIEAGAINLIAGASLVAVSDIFDVIPLNSFVATTVVLSMCAYVYANQGMKQLHLLETLNTVDALTGAMNRRALSADMAAALSKAERTGTQQLLIILDLDYFKSVNDKYGHDGGDQVLKKLVEITNAHIRKYDRLYRFGGEEFVLLVSDISRQQQHGFVNNLQAVIRDKLKTPDGEAVTVSYGVARWVPGITADIWLKRADEALYLAKERGRDRAICYDE